MSLKRGPSFFRTATFRLALRHAALFSVLSLATFVLVYWTLQANLLRRVDTELREDAQEMAKQLLAAPPSQRVATFRADIDVADAGREFRALFDARRRIRTCSDLVKWKGLELTPSAMSRLRGVEEVLSTVTVPGTETRARVIVLRMRDGEFIEFGASLADNQNLLEVVRGIFAMGWTATIIPGLLLGWFMARRAMAGVDRVTATAVQIGLSDLARRVPVGREGEEIENLARAFNEMLDRIGSLVRELKDVTSSIAHDLKSPIARIRAVAESSLRFPTGPHHDEPIAVSIMDECDRLATMIDTILEIAATDGRVAALAPEAVDMGSVARDAVDLFHPAAEDKGVRLTSMLPPGPLWVRGDVSRVQRVVANLLDNAIKYTAPGGSVDVSAEALADRVALSIADSGIGIDADSLPRVFERFYRADPSRSTNGHGLGLSLAQAIVRAYGGEIAARSDAGKGSVFTVLWPSWPFEPPGRRT